MSIGLRASPGKVFIDFLSLEQTLELTIEEAEGFHQAIGDMIGASRLQETGQGEAIVSPGISE